ncbi:MAG TPA: hypothetical protein V6C84_07225 [Coleofasciculaceae cyanobacterium]
MPNLKEAFEKLLSLDKLTATKQVVQAQLQLAIQEPAKVFTFKNLRGGLLLVIGYLLSPLCWWNDLIFNLPIAYLFGAICNRIAPGSLLPGAIAGYWLSNIVGILMMQFGVMDVLQEQSQERNLKKELLTGVVTSTAYTLIILGLVQLKVLDAPNLFVN